MSDRASLTLEEQRAVLRAHLRSHRIDLAAQLLGAPKPAATFPRSALMRLLIGQPALAGWLVTRVAGPRLGVSVTGLLLALGHVRPHNP